MSPDQILAIVTALTAQEPGPSQFPVIAQGGADARYEIMLDACPRPLAPLEIEGQTIQCGFVDVPEDHAEPMGNRLRLAFAVYKSRSLVPAADAVVHLHGGPGSGIVERVAQISETFEQLRQRRDIVVFDQRGVDASSESTHCFRTVAENVEAMALTKIGEAPATLHNDITAACIDELTARGLDLSKINTGQNAMDVRAVMSTLGYPTYNIYGISYGTKLALEVMRTAPDGLRSVVLDSVAPPHIPLFNNLFVPNYEAVKSMADACGADRECDEAYPDILNRYWTAIQNMDATPLVGATGTVTGDDFYSLVESRNDHRHGPRGLTTYIPKMIAEFEAGETTTYDAFVAGRVPPKPNRDSIIANSPHLNDAEVTLAWTALTVAEQISELEQLAARNLEALEADIDTVRANAMIAETFDTELQAALMSLPTRAERSAFASDYLGLRSNDPSKAALHNLVETHFTGDRNHQLSILIDAMQPSDLADVYRRISTDNRGLEQVLAKEFENYMYSCQEDMNVNSNEGVKAVMDTIPAPQELKDFYAAYLGGFFNSCALFDMHPRLGWHDPVVSDIPTLVLAGDFDIQTAVSWALDTASYLPNSQAVVLPETGHGTLSFSDCALDLGEAFVEDPSRTLDATCAKALTPRFLLPDGSLSGG